MMTALFSYKNGKKLLPGKGYKAIDEGKSERTNATEHSDSELPKALKNDFSMPMKKPRMKQATTLIADPPPFPIMRSKENMPTLLEERKAIDRKEGIDTRETYPKTNERPCIQREHCQLAGRKSEASTSSHRRRPEIASNCQGRRSTSLQTEPTKRLTVPANWYYSSNHILINQERARRSITPLVRSSELDDEARRQAEQMALKEKLLYTKQSKVKVRLSVPFQHFGENVASGKSVRSVHSFFVQSSLEKSNMLNPIFKCMGVGTAKGPSDELYVCQIFVG